jgi:hypothetical protein
MSKGPPPPVKPKPKNLPPIVGKKPNIDITKLESTNGKIDLSPKTNTAIEDDNYIASLRGNLRKTGVPVAGSPSVATSSTPGNPKNPTPLGSRTSVNYQKQSTIDSVVSNPITMSMDMSESDEENENENGNDDTSALHAPVTPGRSMNSSTQSPLSPFKKGVDKAGFLLPPQRNNNAIASTIAGATFASPLKTSANTLSPEYVDDVGEGMRSPLKRNIIPPPPKRTLPPKRLTSPATKIDKEDVSKKHPDNDGEGHSEEDVKPPTLPSRKHVAAPEKDTKPSDNDISAPKLPTRRKMAPPPGGNRYPPRKTSASSEEENQIGDPRRGETASDVEYEYEDEYADERSVHVGRHPLKSSSSRDSNESYLSPKPRKPTLTGRSSRRHDEDDEEGGAIDEGYDDYGRPTRRSSSGRGVGTRSSSSLLLDQAKTFSKDSYHTAKVKSAPYAKQALGGLNKMKDKIKSSMNKEGKYEDDSSEEDDDSRYTSLRRGRANSRLAKDEEISSKTQRAPNSRGAKFHDDDEDDEDDEPVAQGRSVNPDESFDEDRPPLPSRKGISPSSSRSEGRIRGIPLPGLAGDDVLKPPHRIKPAVPLKKKPVAPVPPRSSKNDDVLRVLTPPSRRSASNSVSSGSVPPPAPPSRSKAPPAPPSRTGASSVSAWKEPSLDFAFPSLWFIKDNTTELPKDLQGLDYQCSYGYAGQKSFKIYAFRLKDLATVKLKMTWMKDAKNVKDSLTTEVSFIPPPTATAKLLKEGHDKFGEHVANWCEVKEGQTVGNGECWTLAHDALERACGKYAFVSSGLNHGALIATYTGTGNGVPNVSVPAITDEIRRGDILQFRECVFKYPQRTMTCGMPDHTSIVLDVKPSDDVDADGRLKWLEIIHQNMGGVKKVRVADIDLGKLVEGELKVFRPVPIEWIPDLSEVII